MCCVGWLKHLSEMFHTSFWFVFVMLAVNYRKGGPLKCQGWNLLHVVYIVFRIFRRGLVYPRLIWIALCILRSPWISCLSASISRVLGFPASTRAWSLGCWTSNPALLHPAHTLLPLSLSSWCSQLQNCVVMGTGFVTSDFWKTVCHRDRTYGTELHWRHNGWINWRKMCFQCSEHDQLFAVQKSPKRLFRTKSA